MSVRYGIEASFLSFRIDRSMSVRYGIEASFLSFGIVRPSFGDSFYFVRLRNSGFWGFWVWDLGLGFRI